MNFAGKVVNWPCYLPTLLLAAPTCLSIFVIALIRARRAGENSRRRWIAYRDWDAIIQLTLLVAWWLLWDARGPLALSFPGGSERVVVLADPSAAGFWYLPLASLFVYLLVSSTFGALIQKSRRGWGSRLGLVIGRLAAFAAPVLLLEAGIDQLLNRRAWGFLYFAAAGVTWRVGMIVVLYASGIELNALRSGETLGRARRIAHQMGVKLRRVFMVPAGRGRLVNAYSMGNAIAVTDSLGQHLTRDQLEFAIAHEVAHCKRKHTRRMLRTGVIVFGASAAILFTIGTHEGSLRAAAQTVGLVAPMLLAEWNLKRNEYEADAEAITFTRDPESGIRALGNLAKAAALTTGPNWVADLFDAHPCPLYRAREIARIGHLPAERLADILREAEIVEATR